MGKKVSLKDEKILDSWSTLIEDAQEKNQEIFNNTTASIKESQAPGITIESVRVRPSWLQGFFGNERDYLMVTNAGLRDYRMYIGARDYGNNLDVKKQEL
jgi:hypothetical protein